MARRTAQPTFLPERKAESDRVLALQRYFDLTVGFFDRFVFHFLGFLRVRG